MRGSSDPSVYQVVSPEEDLVEAFRTAVSGVPVGHSTHITDALGRIV